MNAAQYLRDHGESKAVHTLTKEFAVALKKRTAKTRSKWSKLQGQAQKNAKKDYSFLAEYGPMLGWKPRHNKSFLENKIIYHGNRHGYITFQGLWWLRHDGVELLRNAINYVFERFSDTHAKMSVELLKELLIDAFIKHPNTYPQIYTVLTNGLRKINKKVQKELKNPKIAKFEVDADVDWKQFILQIICRVIEQFIGMFSCFVVCIVCVIFYINIHFDRYGSKLAVFL